MFTVIPTAVIYLLPALLLSNVYYLACYCQMSILSALLLSYDCCMSGPLLSAVHCQAFLLSNVSSQRNSQFINKWGDCSFLAVIIFKTSYMAMLVNDRNLDQYFRCFNLGNGATAGPDFHLFPSCASSQRMQTQHWVTLPLSITQVEVISLIMNS